MYLYRRGARAETEVNGVGEQGLSWPVKVLDASKDGEIVKFTIQTNITETEVNGVGEQGLSWPVKILDASKDGEIVKFTIQTNIVDESEEEKGVVVLRQYKDLEWLYHCLIAHNNVDGVVIPPLPPKPVTTVSAAEAKSKKQLGKDAKNMVADEFSRDCRNME
ncbi:Sorting nexin-32, partial [Stylophora pistillata]